MVPTGNSAIGSSKFTDGGLYQWCDFREKGQPCANPIEEESIQRSEERMKRCITSFLAMASILAAAGPALAVGIPDSQAGKDTALTDPDATNATINADLKKLGDELQKFADARIPVLWRPLHEPPGNWFWWHDGGPDQFKKLWIHMYDYLVNTRNLHNLIWVYSSSDGGTSNAAWYPGNKYVDIVGVDGYGERSRVWR